MQVAVTGGTGFVGREIVGLLLRQGHAVRVVARGTRPPATHCGWAAGSVLDPGSLPPAFHGCDAVIHLVGIISELGDQTFERVHLDGTRHVLAACHAAGVPRLVHMSALGSRPGARSRYHQSKWAAEELVRNSGLRWTIFRPSLIYGPGDGFVTLFDRMARWLPMLPVFGPGTQQFQPVPVGEVARCFARALEVPESEGRAWELCGPDRLSLNDILESILAATGRTRPLVHLPWTVARMQAGLLEMVFPTLLGKAPPLNRDQLVMLQEDNVGDPGPACRVLGMEPVRFAEGLRGFLKPRR